MSNNYKILISKLDAFIRKYYKNRILKGGIYALALLLSLFLFVVALEHLLQFKQAGRAVLFYLFVGASAYVLVYYILIPIMKLYQFGKVINHSQAADIIGRHFGQVKDKLTNVLQLQEMAGQENNQLLIAGIDQKAIELTPVPFTDAIKFSENKKRLKYVLPPVFIFVLVLIIAPSLIKDSTQRIIKYDENIIPAAPFQFKLESPLQTLKTDDYKLVVSLEGEAFPQKLMLNKDNIPVVMTKEGANEFSYLFKNVNEDLSFSFEGAGYSSAEYTVKVLPKPTLSGLSISLEFPKYLEKENEKLVNSGDLSVPEGTKIQWNVLSDGADRVELHIADTNFLFQNNQTFNLTANTSGNYVIIATNNMVNYKDSVKYTLEVIKDEYPSIEVVEKRDSLDDKRVYFNGAIRDDYGFSKLVFSYQILTKADSLPDRNDVKTIELPVQKSLTENEFFHFWNLEGVELLPGDEISYYFEVWDNDGVNGFKPKRSNPKVLKLKTLNEISKEVDKSSESLKSKMSESIEGAKKLKEDIDKLRKKLSEKKEIGWEEKKEIEELLENQKELEKQLQEINQQNSLKNEQQKELGSQNEEVLEKQEQLQELMEKLMTDELKELMERIEEMMEKLNKNALENNLEEMKLSNEDLEKELDRSLELFKQLEVDQKIEELKEKLSSLSEKQEELSNKTEEKEMDNEQLAQEQEKIANEFDKIKEELEDLKKKDDALERPKGVDEMKDQQKGVEKGMDESSENLNKGKNKKASESQQSAAEEMQEMAQKMEEMQASSSQEGEDMDALRQLLENLLYLSFEQESLMEQLKNTKRQSPEYVKITRNQHKLKNDAKLIEDSLFALSKRVVQLESTVNKEIRKINSNMDKAIAHMEERLNPLAMSRQQMVMTSANNLALLFDEALQQMQEQAKQQQGKGSCNNPGGSGKPKPGPGAMGNMRQLQEQLSKQLNDLKKMMEDGSSPGKGGEEGVKLPGGKGGMSESFAKSAAQQAKIRQKLQELRNNQDGKGKRAIDQMSKLMEETETDLVNKRITQQTLNRQKEILTRLLESDRAEREQEKDEKREAREGLIKNEGNPEMYFEYNKIRDKQVDLLKTTPPNLNRFYKTKVTKYFQSIN